jgi:hypothetical protein
MIRLAFAMLLLLHGLVHLLGFLVPWQVTTSPDFPYTTSAAWGALELGDTGARVVGVVMLGLAAAFAFAAFGIWRRHDWGLPLAVGSSLVSLIACVLQSPAAILGVVLNGAILVAVVLVRLDETRLHVVHHAEDGR